MDSSDGRDVLTELAARVRDVADAITRQIRSEVAGMSRVPFEDHKNEIVTQINYITAGLMAREPPSEDIIEYVRALGVRRAMRQVPLADVVESYHIGFREVWNSLVTQATIGGPHRTSALVGDVALLWNWFHSLITAVVESYSAQARILRDTEMSLRRRFVDIIDGSPATGDEFENLARMLRFDPVGEFVVGCVDGVPESDVERLGADLAQEGGTVVACWGGGRAVVLAQNCSVPALLSLLRSQSRPVLTGFSMPRRGLDGLLLAMSDAQDALGRARVVRTDVLFSDEWLMSVLTGLQTRLDPLMARGVETARKYPHLAATVRAFLDNRNSLTACARALHIHPNGAKYRLDRWRSLTGWDVQTVQGIVASHVCLSLWPEEEPEGEQQQAVPPQPAAPRPQDPDESSG